MVFEGDTSQFFTESPSSFTDAEWENIRLKNLQLTERHGFVAVPDTENFNTLLEGELNKLDKLSEAGLEEMVERTLNSESFSQNFPAPVTQSVVPSFEEDSSNQKKCNVSDLVSFDGECSFDGSNTEPEQDFEATESDPLEETVGSRSVSTTCNIPTGQATQSGTGASIVNPFALTILPQVAAKMATGLYTLVLEPLPSTNPTEPLSFVYKAVPIRTSTPQTPSNQGDNQKEQNVGSDSEFQQNSNAADTDTDTETDAEIPQTTPANTTPSEQSTTKKRGLGTSYEL